VNQPSDTAEIIRGVLSADDRGEVAFVNDFHFDRVKRYYLVSNYRQGFVRAWHAHRRERKYVTVVQGSALVGVVCIDDWEHPSKDLEVLTFTLSAHAPAILCIPPGYANGFMSLTENCKILFFSTASLDESKDDDIRYDSRYWDIWHVTER
jgi:dTDP-4-dehydrorhamnose 3,5-epimerase